MPDTQPLMHSLMPPQPRAYIVGLDLGQSADYSAQVILEHAGPGDRPWQPEQHFHLRHLRRWPLGTPYPEVVRDVVMMLGQPPLAGNVTLAIDRTGVGAAVYDLFRAALGRSLGAMNRLVAISIHGGNQVTRDGDGYGVPKRDLAGSVQAALQTRRLTIAEELPDTRILVAELQNFRVKISLGGHDSYGAGVGEEWRVGSHDDLVLAVACALWTGQRSRGATLHAM
jgi:hypothetical protein